MAKIIAKGHCVELTNYRPKNPERKTGSAKLGIHQVRTMEDLMPLIDELRSHWS